MKQQLVDDDKNWQQTKTFIAIIYAAQRIMRVVIVIAIPSPSPILIPITVL